MPPWKWFEILESESSSTLQIEESRWNIWVNFPRTGKMVKMWHFFILELCCDQTVWFFQLFLIVLKRFFPLHSKNTLFLVLANVFFALFTVFTLKLAFFGIIWGRNRGFLLLDVYSWTRTNVPITLEIVFIWFSYFWFPSSSSRTRARAV